MESQHIRCSCNNHQWAFCLCSFVPSGHFIYIEAIIICRPAVHPCCSIYQSFITYYSSAFYVNEFRLCDYTPFCSFMSWWGHSDYFHCLGKISNIAMNIHVETWVWSLIFVFYWTGTYKWIYLFIYFLVW